MNSDTAAMSDRDLLVTMYTEGKAQAADLKDIKVLLRGREGRGGLVSAVDTLGLRMNNAEVAIVNADRKAEDADDEATKAQAKVDAIAAQVTSRKASVPPRSRASGTVKAAWIGGVTAVVVALLGLATML